MTPPSTTRRRCSLNRQPQRWTSTERRFTCFVFWTNRACAAARTWPSWLTMRWWARSCRNPMEPIRSTTTISCTRTSPCRQGCTHLPCRTAAWGAHTLWHSLTTSSTRESSFIRASCWVLRYTDRRKRLDDGQMPFQKGPDHNASRTFTPPSSTSSSTQPSSSSANKTHGLSAKDTAAVVAVSTAVGTLMMTLLVWLSCRKCRRHSRYHPCARGFFCSAPSPHIEENPRSSGWTRDTWRCDYRLYQSLSKSWHALVGPPSRGSTRHVHTPSSVSSADGALLANESKTEDLQVATLEAPSTRGAQVPQLVLTIPSWSGCSLEEERPPTPPPKPLRTPRTPPTPSNRPDPSRKSECTLGDSGRDRDETATHTSTLTTPTAYYPSGCFLPAPRSPDLPARADSVTTIPLVPNRHADMADAGPAVVTVSLEDAADVRAAGGEGLGKEVFARIGAMWHASRPPSLHGSPADR
ncbi:hypothetical protein AcV7_000269 [Taiwanofungus camphoratus]|nr:hypothetical protein AcV7_000269 [Antrodia cinnamomea]